MILRKGGKRVLILRGAKLREALGFMNDRAFQRARKKGAVLVPFYPIPGQSRGVYAFKEDVDEYMKGKAETRSTRQSH